MMSITKEPSFTAFREQRALLMLVTAVIAYVPYFVLVPKSPSVDVATLLTRLAWFAGATLGHAAMVGIGMIALGLRTPRADRAQADERDRAIDRHAASIAYYVLMTGAVIVGIMMPFGRQGWQIVNATLFAIVVAEAVRQAAIIRAYRRGWHG
jgi:hypothetical protein